jgi:pimeloyl-ACP methyl ester carboxylesterase
MKKWVLYAAALWLQGVSLSAQTLVDQPSPKAIEDSMFNIKTPTLGGKQFWTDHAWRKGWRIQHNAITGHWRLLSDKNVRYAWGTREQCQVAMDRQVPDASQSTTEVVILMHGLMRSSTSMQSMGKHLESELKIQPIYFEYASTRSSITDHALAFGEFVDSLPADVQLNLVGHSMGNIVARHYIGDLQRAGQTEKLKRIRSVVMLGPPNQGASIARQLAKTGVFGWIAGKGGLELGPGWQEFQARLATPVCPFGIVAGKLPDSTPANPLVDGDSDFVVSFEETQLPGAADVITVPRLHSFLMDAPEVQAATANFIKSRSKFND